jgi:hypothetical protein
MSETELKGVSAELKKLAARVEALERLLQRIIRQKPVSERQLERALRSWGRSERNSVRSSDA